MDRVISLMINVRLEVPAVSTDINTCKSECTKLNGRMPYLLEGKSQSKWMSFSERPKLSFFRLLPFFKIFRTDLTLWKVDSIIEKLYHSNGTIKRSRIPLEKKRGGDIDERKFLFFLNSQFDFSNQVWKSGLFEIPDSNWDDIPEYKYPILGDGSHWHLVLWVLFSSYAVYFKWWTGI